MKEKKENPLSLEIWGPYRVDPWKNPRPKISRYCPFKRDSPTRFFSFRFLYEHAPLGPFDSLYKPHFNLASNPYKDEGEQGTVTCKEISGKQQKGWDIQDCSGNW
jgi:hypothetical protein